MANLRVLLNLYGREITVAVIFHETYKYVVRYGVNENNSKN